MDPDLQKITKIGKVGGADPGENDDSEDSEGDFDKYMPQEFLKKLPGMDTDKIRNLTGKRAKALGIRTVLDMCRADFETLS